MKLSVQEYKASLYFFEEYEDIHEEAGLCDIIRTYEKICKTLRQFSRESHCKKIQIPAFKCNFISQIFFRGV